MNCEQTRDLLTAYALGDLDEAARAEVATHLKTCEGCRAAASDLQPTLDLLRDALAAAPVAPRRLSSARRARVRKAATPGVRRMVWWAMQRHPALMAAAALLVVGFLVVGTMLPAVGGRREAARISVVRCGVPPALPSPEVDVSTIEAAAPAAESAPSSGQPVEMSVAAGATVELGEKPAAESQTLGYGIAARAGEQAGSGGAGSPGGSPSPSGVTCGLADSREGKSRAEPESGYTSGGVAAPAASAASAPAGAPAALGRPIESAVSEKLAQLDETKALAPARAKQQAAADMSGADGRVEKGDVTVLAAGEEEAVEAPEPAPFDTVTVAKSPIVMKGMYASRSPGARGSSLAKYGGGRAGGKDAWVEEDKDQLVAVPAKEKAGAEMRFRAADGIAAGEDRKKVAEKPADDAYAYGADSASKLEIARPQEAESGARAAAADGGRRLETVSEQAAQRVDQPADHERNAKAEQSEPTPDRPRFRASGVNPFLSAAEQPFSTFAIDVDTAAYTLARNYMLQGFLPPAEAVRTEEFVNFFDYGYKPPAGEMFKVYAQVAPSRFGRGLHLLAIGVKGRRLGREEQRRACLTFLVDTSGSMDKPDRLGLVQKSLRMLVDRLGPDDVVAIVQYDSHARLVLEPTRAAEKETILKVVAGLQCGRSTNLEEGMRLAYEVAAANFVSGGENRVLVLSDGAANLGAGSAEDILKVVEARRRQGVRLSVFGFGMGTYDDVMLETLANKGDGAYAFIDSEEEARRVFVDDLASTLNTIASDVKIQVEFNAKRVAKYRQVGYENRQLKKEDFRNDAVDAGEVGSGQSVTALYEIELMDAAAWRGSEPVAVLRVRHRQTDAGEVKEIERPVTESDRAATFEQAPAPFRLAACVAEFAEILRGSPFAQGSEFSEVAAALRPVALEFGLDQRVAELLRLVESAGGMSRAPANE
jgi:Ca-activated chloride channel family protein